MSATLSQLESGARYAVLAIVLSACASPGVSVVSTPATPAVRRDSIPRPAPPLTAPTVTVAPWTIRVRQHVDLWLHGFAMLQGDSTLIPYFRRDYRAQLTQTRAKLGLTSQLDLSSERLTARLAANPALVSAQFVPLYFSTWDELRQAADVFLRAAGDPRAVRDQRASNQFAVLAANFPSAADREWLRVFLLALEDENTKFYDRYWRDRQRELGPVFDAADGLWRFTYGARFERFLRNAQQRDGEILVSLPLAGEGRTLTLANRQTTVAVGFPTDTSQTRAVVFAFAHEIVGPVANAVIEDNTSPADRRNGVADRYTSLAAVRGGAMLLGRIAPELVPGYMAYYLDLARQPTATDVDRRFAAIFTLPDGLRDALQRQIDIILGGI